jgi:ferredoxin-NADP reductase
MAREAARAGVPWRLLYVGESRASMPFVDDLLSLPGGTCVIAPADECPAVDLVAAMDDLVEGVQVYCCGSRQLCEDVRTAAGERLPTGAVHEESCSYSSPPASSRVADQPGPTSTPRHRAGLESRA